MRPKHILRILCLVFIVSLTAFNVEARTETFSVPPETDLTKPLFLKENDRVSIGFSVIGETNNEIDFFITNPSEEVIYPYENTGHVSFSFLTAEAGTYTLHFHNAKSIEAKTVTLNCDVEHYIFGVPQEMFLTIIIALICVLAVAAFILVGKPR